MDQQPPSAAALVDEEEGSSDPTTNASTSNQPLLSEEEVLGEEALAVSRRREALGLAPSCTHGIGVSFSGGGVRAASFDTGVLWKLGELGLLKHVDHLSAVSGGGYTACSWMTHVAASEQGPPTGDIEKLDAWYSMALTWMITRMQDNIGYLVTTSHSLFRSPGKARGGSEYGHVFDIPAFIAILVGMPAANVVSFVVSWALILASLINMNHGHSMRAFMCSKTSNYNWFPAVSTFGCVISIGIYFILKIIDSTCRVRASPPRHYRWLIHECSKRLWSRAALVFLTYGVLVVGAMSMQQFAFGRAHERREIKCACARFYGKEKAYDWTIAQFHNICDDVKSPPLANKRSFAAFFLVFVSMLFGGTGLVALLGAPALIGLVARVVAPLAGILGVSYIAEWRVFGPVTKQRLVSNHLPYNSVLWSYLFFTCCAVAIAILPYAHELRRTLHRFYARSLRRAFFADAEDYPLAALRDGFELPNSLRDDEEEQSGSSSESPPTLQQQQQQKGRTQLSSEGATPNLILGATVNEFRRPEDPLIPGKMFVLTPRAWGGTHTGYARPPLWLSLSRAMAISGAAIDGFVLNVIQSKALRFALQFFNLTMGDTIRFSGALSDDDDDAVKVSAPLAAAVEFVEGPGGILCGRHDEELREEYQLHRRKRKVDDLLQNAGAESCCDLENSCCKGVGAGIRVGDPLSSDELASTLYARRYEMLVFTAVYALFMISASLYSKSDDKTPFLESPAPFVAAAGVLAMALVVATSIYAGAFERLRFLLNSPIVQQVHLLLQITHFGTRAPPSLTLTDGGLTETIGIVELLRRRCRWIVLVDTCEDPTLSCEFIKTNLDLAFKENLYVGDVADAGSPRVDGKSDQGEVPYEELLSPSIQEREYVRLRVTYPPSSSSQEAQAADVFVVKMRQRPGPPQKCEKLISPSEVYSSPHSEKAESPHLPVPLLDVDADPLDVDESEINGCCCECSHTSSCCKCIPCGHLPFLSVANQFLTPFQFSTLSRLGRHLSDAPLKVIRDELVRST